MVETLVAFVVLVLILLMINQIIIFCSDLKMKTQDTDRIIGSFNTEIYKKTGVDSSEVGVTDYRYITGKGPVFYITLDTANAEMMTYNVKDTDDSKDYSSFKLRMNNVFAKGYKSNNDLIDSEKLVTPKALCFYYYDHD